MIDRVVIITGEIDPSREIFEGFPKRFDDGVLDEKNFCRHNSNHLSSLAGAAVID